MAEETSARRESPAVLPGLPSHARSDSACSPARRAACVCRFGCRNDCSVGDGENAEKRPLDGLQMVFGENRGGAAPGIVPEEAFRVACGRVGWMRARRGPAERYENWTPSQPHRYRAETRPRKRFPFPAESEPTSARESERCFPKKNTHRPGVCGRWSLSPAGRGLTVYGLRCTVCGHR